MVMAAQRRAGVVSDAKLKAKALQRSGDGHRSLNSEISLGARPPYLRLGL